MVLHENESGKFFDKDLLALMWELKNDDVRRILEEYQPTETSLPITRLRDASQATLLHIAAKYGNEVIAKYLIDLGSEVDARDSLDRTPLTLALTEKREKVIPVLLEANADLQLTNSHAKIILERLLMTKSTDPSVKKFFKEMSSQKIAKIGFIKYVRDTNWSFSDAAVLDNVELMKLLLNQGPYAVDDPDTFNGTTAGGKTALHIAVQRKNLDMVKMLLEYGADVDALDASLRTPIRYLYYNDIYRDNIDKDNGTAEYLDILKILLSHEISLTTCSSAGYMQIYNVLVYGCKEAVKLVLQRVNDLSVADDNFGESVVHYLANNCNEGVIELLKDREFDVNIRDRLGRTPLHCAWVRYPTHVAEFLLENGANVHARDSRGRTPLRSLLTSLCAYFKVTEAKRDAQLLLDYGSKPLDSHVEFVFDMYSNVYNLAVRGDVVREPRKILTLMEPILARLAVDEAFAVEITEVVRSKIALQPFWVEHLDLCRRQVDRMRETRIYGDVTLLKFLTESQTKITGYARNEELVCELEKAIEEFEADSPYTDLLRKRFTKATWLSELREKAMAVVCRLIMLENHAHYFEAGHIIDYLRSEDMENLIGIV